MKHYAGPALMKLWIWIASLFFGIATHGQDIAIGTWRTHYSYQNARILEPTENKLFCAVENGLFSFDIEDHSIRKLSKIDGLSGAGVSALHYNTENRVLVIGYYSGLIDLVYEDRILTLRDVVDSNLEGDKKINAITSQSNQAFLGTDLGIIVINFSTGQISENFIQIGSNGDQVSVSEIVIWENELYIITNEGAQSGNLDLNLLDFNNWAMFPSSSSYTNLTLVGDEVYSLNGLTLIRFSNGIWENTNYELPDGATDILNVNNQLLTYSGNTIFQLNEQVFEEILSTSVNEINDIQFLQTAYFIADEEVGLVDEEGNRLSPLGTLSDTYSGITILAGEVFGFHAPSPFTFDGSQKVNSFSHFMDGNWDLIDLEGFTNVSDVATFNGERYYSSIGDGLLIDGSGEVLANIPNSNSSSDSIITALDSRGELWIAGFGDQPLHSLDRDGNWISYESNSVFDNEFLAVDIAESGIVWALASDGAITIIGDTEDEIDIINVSDGLPSGAFDFDISIEDNAWVATSRGPALFPSASFVFIDAEAIRPTFENRTLFEDQQINTVVTDGGNRIWFGTNRGLWVFDENTSEQVAVFNEQNSPLPSNVVLDLAYNGVNGEIFVVTERGMVSYRSASSNGGRAHRNVTVFPNPVRPDYVGLVGISGLARNVSLKVTDVNGNLVKELRSNGGSIAWDLLNENGGQVTTGIYFFFSSTSDGEETFVGKVAVIR